MAVKVRMFAALREAAGSGEVELAPGPLPALLDELRARHDERFGDVLRVCSVLVDGTAVARDAGVEVRDGAEIALLPPVSGGASRYGRMGRVQQAPSSAIPGG